MRKRIISGAVYVGILTAFFLLRELVYSRIFDLFIYFLMVAGTFEIARATKMLTIKGSFYLSILYALALIPTYYMFEHILFFGYGKLAVLYLFALMVVINLVLGIILNAEPKKLFWTILLYVYPALLLYLMFLTNDTNVHAFTMLILAFVISPISDTFAYFVGSKIGGKKLCPRLSPKKTWSGAIGGTIGGILSSVIVYFIFKPQINSNSPVMFFLLLGIIASIANIFGDLFESFIKRKVGIKDMGKIMPGHGGVLDRIDGTMFVMLVIYIMFLFV